jgi:hypothetical protein
MHNLPNIHSAEKRRLLTRGSALSSGRLEIVWSGHDLPKVRGVLLAPERIPSADIRILHEAGDME